MLRRPSTSGGMLLHIGSEVDLDRLHAARPLSGLAATPAEGMSKEAGCGHDRSTIDGVQPAAGPPPAHAAGWPPSKSGGCLGNGDGYRSPCGGCI
mmetsp:Transcript_49587/g.91484  ORF Transcript_49587/g.91484 Transcript_49587/m.91484 type:complete len:95 (+) Transcript_49587:241-525(+)